MFRLFSILVIASVMLTGCSKNKDNNPPPPRPPGPSEPSRPLPATNIVEARYISLTDNIGGFYESLPPQYDSSTAKFPLLVFLHGGGERGNGTTELSMILRNGLGKRLRDKTFPTSFTVGSQSYSFVVLAPQFRDWPRSEDVHTIIQYATKHYKIDTQRIYLAGMSMGGGATWEYSALYGRSLAAIVPICGASWADTATARKIAGTHVPTWAFHNNDDSAVIARSTTRYIDFINLFSPNPAPRLTLWPTGGHDAWTKATDPDYKEDGKNIYEWMLQFAR